MTIKDKTASNNCQGIEYIYDVMFKSIPCKYTYRGIEKNLSEGCNCIRVITDPIKYAAYSDKWENAMIDSLLDDLKGTDWSNVKNVWI